MPPALGGGLSFDLFAGCCVSHEANTTPSTVELTVSNAESVRGWPGPESRRC
jgi:hypothetical protein